MKTIISYIAIFAMLILYALFLDATSGFFVLIIFGSAIVMSSLLHAMALKAFECELNVNAALVEKGEDVTVTLRLGKAAFFLPTVFEIVLELSEHIENVENTENTENATTSCVMALSHREKEHTFNLKSVFWGKANIGIASVRAIDVLGIFEPFFKGYLRNKAAQTLSVKIFPGLPELSQKSELVRTLEDASAYDDNEQSREAPFAMVGFPGYEHRDYVPGDSFKSINWKLSAKRDKLLVRKPEAYAGGDQVLILDRRSCKPTPNISPKQVRAHEQLAIESMLSLAKTLSKQEIVCRVYVQFESGLSVTEITGDDDIERLRFEFTEYFYTEFGSRLPDVSSESASGFVIFTASPDDELAQQVRQSKQKGAFSESMSEIVSPVDGSANNWKVLEVDGEVVFEGCN